MKIVLASANNGKIREIRRVLEPLGYEILSLKDINFNEEIEENGSTFFENALIKAKAISKYTDYPIIADDSGICCLALDNGPGIYSHRFGNKDTDEERNEFLIESLQGKDRTAYFSCTIVFYYKDIIKEFEGRIYGEIIDTPRGENGFGYDPIFYVKELGKTTAEIPMEEKNKISHRGKAIELLRRYLENDFDNK